MEAIRSRSAPDAERRFYFMISAMMIAVVFAGFAPSWFLRPWLHQPFMQPLTPLVWLHGVLFTAWAALFMTQVSLVAAGRRDLHRRLGVSGVFFAVALAVVGVISALYQVGRASGPPGIPPLSFLAVPLFSVPAFTWLLVSALRARRQPAVHKRLMILMMVTFLQPAFGRMPFLFPGLIGLVLMPALFVAALMLWDLRSLGRVHRATKVGGAVAIGSMILPLLIMDSAAWLAFARWASGLVV